MSDETALTKSIIRGILISNPQRSNIQQLARDFSEMEGRPVPFKKLGYPSLELFLKSIPDTVKVYGSGLLAEVEAVVTDKSEHINAMVQSQKKCSKHRSNRHNSSKRWQPPRLSSPMNNNPIPSLFVQQYMPPQMQYYAPPMSYSVERNTNNTSPKDTSNEVRERESNRQEGGQRNGNSEEVAHLKPKEEPVCGGSDEKVDSDSDDDPTSRVPYHVRQRLATLIKNFPSGLECTKLPTEYRKMFKRRLNYGIYGFRSLIEMCVDLSNIFSYVQHSLDDYILYDAKGPLPVLDSKDSSSEEEESQFEDGHLDTQIFRHMLNSSDVITISEELDRLFPDAQVDDVLEVKVAEIYDLSKFWVYMTFGGLNKLMKELNVFYAENKSRYRVPAALQEVGLYCVSTYCDKFHRCCIVDSLPDSDCVRVFYVDYGTVENVPSSEVWFLAKKFGALPCQAIRMRLANICPVHESRPWPAAAVARFEQLITRRTVAAKITHIDPREHVVEVYLADITDTDDIFYINDVLVEEQLAGYLDQEQEKSFVDFDCMPNVRYLHLYPQFYEIEAGLAPTQTEMRELRERKVPMHHYLPQYFDIYYQEDVEQLLAHHERTKQIKISDSPFTSADEDFDYTLFPEDMQDEVRELVNTERREKLEAEMKSSVKEYKCNKKRISDYINSDNGASLSQSSSPDRESVRFPPTNPFYNDCRLSATTSNPFRSTNPFLHDEVADLNARLLGLFSKKAEDSAPLKESCKCNKNVGRSSDPVQERPARVRTPPGFSSRRQENAPNASAAPPSFYYQNLPAFNSFFLPNQITYPVYNSLSYLNQMFPHNFNANENENLQRILRNQNFPPQQ